MKGKTNIVLSGVGGQGVITAANILGKAAVEANINVFVSEIHGMAQRGGSVLCTVRMGNVSSPLIMSGAADALISTEPIEALRYIKYASSNTKIITDLNPVIPFTVTVGDESYPDLEDVFKILNSNSGLYKINALKIAKDSGGIITKNIVMLGALAAVNVLPFKSDILLETILKNISANYKRINKNAFIKGLDFIKSI
jgi:indolepyruvate ferredoxin oxidoreductase beta subunit